MDETDLRLLDALIRDSRTSYAVLARRLRLSIPAVHKRVAALLETGVIAKFTANLSVGFLHAVPVYLSGVSPVSPIRDAVQALRGSDRTGIIVRGSGNSVYVRALLPTIQDLEAYVAFFRKATSIASPSIGIEALMAYGSAPPTRGSPEAAELDPRDYRILAALHDDSRKPVADVCEELRLSPKTVRNRLRRMVEDEVVEFSIHVQPGTHAGASAYLTIFVKSDTDVSALRRRLIADLGPRLLWSTTMSNAPNALTAQMWSPTPVAHDEAVNRVSSYAEVEKVLAYFIIHYDWCETWRDALLRRRAVDAGA